MPNLRGHEPAIWAAAFVEMMTKTVNDDGPEEMKSARSASYAAAWANEMVECARLAIPDALPLKGQAMLREMLGEGEVELADGRGCIVSSCQGPGDYTSAGGQCCEGHVKTVNRWVAMDLCPSCGGSKAVTCPTCHGTGQPGEGEDG
jgi:hypothetical protein